MATTWAATASNQAVTREALQDAINNNIFNWYQALIPTTDITKCVNRNDAWLQYVVINQPVGLTSNQIVVKSDITVLSGFDKGTSIGGRRDGADVDIHVTFSSTGNTVSYTINSTTCKPYRVFGNTTDTLTIVLKNSSNQNIKFWLSDNGSTCPVGGTQYNSYVITPTSIKNLLFVPVWTGSSYVLV